MVIRLARQEVVVVQASNQVEQTIQLLPCLSHGPHCIPVGVLEPCSSHMHYKAQADIQTAVSQQAADAWPFVILHFLPHELLSGTNAFDLRPSWGKCRFFRLSRSAWPISRPTLSHTQMNLCPCKPWLQHMGMPTQITADPSCCSSHSGPTTTLDHS